MLASCSMAIIGGIVGIVSVVVGVVVGNMFYR